MNEKIHQVKEMISNNELEEALNLLIEIEENQEKERYHTLLLLKGKLAMLKEQELSGMIGFDEVSEQKLRISHSLLKMTDDEIEQQQRGGYQPQPSPPFREKETSIMPYVMGGIVVGMGALLFFLLREPKVENPPTEPVPKEEIIKNEPTPEKKITTPKQVTPTRQVERKETPTRTVEKKETPPAVINQPRVQTETKPTPPPSAPPKKAEPTPPPEPQVRLYQFPNLNRAFNFGDLKYTFTAANLDKSGSQLNLRLKYDIKCRNNLGVCNRETTEILVDDQPIKPSKQRNPKKWMDSGTSTQEELVFTFPSNAQNYKIRMNKNGSTWVRGFKVLQ